jgi:hypothetical protein
MRMNHQQGLRGRFLAFTTGRKAEHHEQKKTIFFHIPVPLSGKGTKNRCHSQTLFLGQA